MAPPLHFPHLLIEGVPVGPLGTVLEGDHEYGQTWLAHEEDIQVLLVGNDDAIWPHLTVVLPEVVPVDEEVLEERLVAILQQVKELRRVHREMVEHQVEFEAELSSSAHRDPAGDTSSSLRL